MPVSNATSKPKTPRKPKSAPALQTVPRKIGDESHPWCSELGGIPRRFGARVDDQSDNTPPIVVETAPVAPTDGKIATLPTPNQGDAS